jgi:hypothetical protein
VAALRDIRDRRRYMVVRGLNPHYKFKFLAGYGPCTTTYQTTPTSHQIAVFLMLIRTVN